ncbi:hypothetical protein [uncultured Vibrio sp.]|uniref:hypothetical protein n=1 Tax=uncultured Vibrio sp. TaxID=114054 RepID=UPI0025D201E3|nr:hypothetical protein [uncultured Vibrio sp.]
MDANKRSQLTKAFNDFIVTLFFFIFVLLLYLVPPQALGSETCSALSGIDAPFPTGNVPDDGKPLTATRQFCNINNYCEGVVSYTASNGSVTRSSFYTGYSCAGYEEGGDNSALDEYAQCGYYGCSEHPSTGNDGDVQTPPLGCEKPYEDVDFVCREDTDGDGYPNLNAPYDTAAHCKFDYYGEFSCQGGSYETSTEIVEMPPRESTVNIECTGDKCNQIGNFTYELRVLSSDIRTFGWNTITQGTQVLNALHDNKLQNGVRHNLMKDHVSSVANTTNGNVLLTNAKIDEITSLINNLEVGETVDIAPLINTLDSIDSVANDTNEAAWNASDFAMNAAQNSASNSDNIWSMSNQLKKLETSISNVGDWVWEIESAVWDAGDYYESQMNKKFTNISNDVSYVEDLVVDGFSDMSTAIEANALAIDGLSSVSGGTGTDLSGVVGSIGQTNDLLGDIRSLVGCDGDCLAGFAPEGKGYGSRFLYDSERLVELNASIDSLKIQAQQEIQHFRTLFSFDTTAMNRGTYKDHSLNLFLNGQSHSFKSGVLPALIDNATLIASIILFIAVLLGIKSLGN